MPDYGHPLRFGVFITPAHGTSIAGNDPADLAVTAEELGFDLVTFQDHPYQPSFYDTWTLLSFVAARTSRVQLAGNVLNLPLRPPLVLAKSVASLDRLSSGRVALGLGTGAFWDAIEAMGVPRRSAGEAVTGLEEAIDAIRQSWDAATLGGIRVDGDIYRIRGAKRGPAPAHDVPIWLGAYGPRMLRVTGRLADGWLPSLSYMKPGDLARGNTMIDESAERAGREPREIVRLLNIGPNMTPDAIAGHVLDDGVSTFIVAADDARTMEFFASTVIPRARQLVQQDREAAGTSVAPPPRSSRARNRRMPGIGYDDVPASLRAGTIEPGDPGYGRYTHGYLRGGAPGIVLRAATPDEVSDAVAFAHQHRDVPLGIFSAGHGLSGRSINHGGVVIDVGQINHVDVRDPDRGIVHVGPGARWVEVAAALAPHGLAITSGDYGGVGVGGLATAGGVGMFARSHGLTIDLLRSVQVVLADGSVVRASATAQPDLFWAVRGAGANFGVVTDFEFAAPKVGDVAFAQLTFDATDTATFLERFGAAMQASPRSVSGEIILGGPGRGGTLAAQAMLLVNESEPDAVIDALQPVAHAGPLLDQQVSMATYDQIMSAFFRDTPQQANGEPRSHAGLTDVITRELALEAGALLHAGASYFFQIRCMGGATADVQPDDTAFAWRDANFVLSALGTRSSELDRWWDRLLPHLSGLYLNLETDTGPEVLRRAFPPAHLDRLRVLKHRYDPTGLFRDNFFIAPQESTPRN